MFKMNKVILMYRNYYVIIVCTFLAARGCSASTLNFARLKPERMSYVYDPCEKSLTIKIHDVVQTSTTGEKKARGTFIGSYPNPDFTTFKESFMPKGQAPVCSVYALQQ